MAYINIHKDIECQNYISLNSIYWREHCLNLTQLHHCLSVAYLSAMDRVDDH